MRLWTERAANENPGYGVTELIYYFTPLPRLLSVLVCACGFWKPVECLGKTRTVGGWGVQADLILLSSGAAALRLCLCTCLLFILRSGKDGGRKPHFLPSEGALVFPQLPHERHFCLAVKNIALHLLLMRFALVFFSSPFSFKRLIVGPGSQILFPQG